MYELALNGYDTSLDLIFRSFVGMIAKLDFGSLEKTKSWRLMYSDLSNGKLIEIPVITAFWSFQN
tara:strand:- start:1636 stop:1830 length:195 start_codon:yes stop_codon:yes gene_type:complete